MLSLQKWTPDGVLPFCRSMGQPEIEELMFSYSWAVEEENIRTIAKAVWQAGVGVWIDVIKLSPGDEIRPVVRTMVKHVRRCIVFLSPGSRTFNHVSPHHVMVCLINPSRALPPPSVPPQSSLHELAQLLH
jgi:hypothetical protein